MKQGQVFRVSAGDEIVCLVQTDLGVETPYLLCAPVVARSDWGRQVPKLHIPVDLNGTSQVIVMSQMVALPATVLGACIGDVSARRDDIVAAVDLLVTGF